MRGNHSRVLPRLSAGTDSSSSNDSSFDSSRSHRPFDQHEQRFLLRDRDRCSSMPAPRSCEREYVQIGTPSRRCHLHNNQIVKDHFTTYRPEGSLAMPSHWTGSWFVKSTKQLLIQYWGSAKWENAILWLGARGVNPAEENSSLRHS
jgi:hypothetical protein